MITEMDEDSVAGYFRGKGILITGSTGFLGKGMCSCMITASSFQVRMCHACVLIICEAYVFFLHDFWAVLVKKILRVPPDVKKLVLLIRAPDIESAKLRIQTEVKYSFSAFLLQNYISFVNAMSIKFNGSMLVQPIGHLRLCSD